jgi:hypothetical protein
MQLNWQNVLEWARDVVHVAFCFGVALWVGAGLVAFIEWVREKKHRKHAA